MTLEVIKQTLVTVSGAVIHGEQAPIQIAAKVGKGETLSDALSQFEIVYRDPVTWEILEEDEDEDEEEETPPE